MYGLRRPDGTLVHGTDGTMFSTPDVDEAVRHAKKIVKAQKAKRDVALDRERILAVLQGRPATSAADVARTLQREEAEVRRDLDALVLEGAVDALKSFRDDRVTRGQFARRGAMMRRKVTEYRVHRP
jgi:predicted HTH transcriptional regulator